MMDDCDKREVGACIVITTTSFSVLLIALQLQSRNRAAHGCRDESREG